MRTRIWPQQSGAAYVYRQYLISCGRSTCLQAHSDAASANQAFNDEALTHLLL